MHDIDLLSPSWFPFQIDPATDQVTLVHFSEQDFRTASFLDQRALGPRPQARAVKWQDLARALPAGARRDAQFIFHLGNVGSTLISRLLGEVPGCLGLREPLLLRTFAEQLAPEAGGWGSDEGAARLETLRALLSRTFRREQRVLVKATSFTSEIASLLVPRGSRALFLFATPRHYIENILAGENSRQNLQMMTPLRLRRLARRCPGLALDPMQLSDGRKAALGWACEMTSLVANAKALPEDHVLWQDFDRFLANPADRLEAIASHFGMMLDDEGARVLCSGPLMHRYSKALEYEFTPGDRRAILEESRWQNRAQIEDGLRWLEAMRGRYPDVHTALEQAERNG